MSTIKTIVAWLILSSWWAVAHAGTVTYVYTDPQGTPLAEADAQGNITARFDYSPYGVSVASLGASPNGPGYTGHVNDPDTGLVYMQARYYDPEVGRFLGVDPEGPAAGDAFSFNRYAYVDNNPVTNTDPTGRQCAQCLYSPNDSIDHQAAILQAASRQALEVSVGFVPVVGDAQNVYEAIANPSPLNVAIAVVGAVPEVGGELATGIKEATAAERATAIAGSMTERTKGSVTIAVTETEEGVRVVSSSEGALRTPARAMLQQGEVEGKGVARVHAEVNGVNAAKKMGLTPTGTAASRPICPQCAKTLDETGVKPLSPLKE